MCGDDLHDFKRHPFKVLEDGAMFELAKSIEEKGVIVPLILRKNPYGEGYEIIENPRGGMRKMEWMKDLPRYTVTYCQYGDNRMKPTDIWTNHPAPQFLPMCHNGDSCHVAAPRGSKTGTQGLKGSRERSVITRKLCEHIVDICEEYLKEDESGK